MTETELRNKMVAQARSWLGCKESDGSFKKIIDVYNSHKPLARGYPLQYTDHWCDGFVSAVAIACGMTDIIPTEVGCGKHIDLFKQIGCWQEDDAYVPKPGDYIFYDWQDGPNFATTDNLGNPDHVGIVETVVGNTITVIEGNMNEAVGRRTIQVNGRYIRGYGTPNYAKKAGSSSVTGSTAVPSAPQTNKKDEITVGCKVHMDSQATIYGKSAKFASFVYAKDLYVRQIDGNRIVVSIYPYGDITGAVHKKYLTKI